MHPNRVKVYDIRVRYTHSYFDVFMALFMVVRRSLINVAFNYLLSKYRFVAAMLVCVCV